MDKTAWALTGINLESGLIKTPINTNKFLAELNLGMKAAPKAIGENKPGEGKPVPIATSSAFKPDKALIFADKALQHTKEILMLDPLDPKAAKANNGIAAIYDALAHVIEKPENFNMHVGEKGEAFVNDKGEKVQLKGGEVVGKNSKNIPILIEADSVQKLQKLRNEIKKDRTFDDLLRESLIFPKKWVVILGFSIDRVEVAVLLWRDSRP